MEKSEFLEALVSRGKNKYKRYQGLPLRYAGGKSLGVGVLVENLPPVQSMVSPFFGGGSFEIACSKEIGIEVKGYDVFEILTTYWDVQINQPQTLAQRIGQWTPDTDTYAGVKERLKGHWTGANIIEDKTEVAAHYWYNHNLSYGPGFLGWMSKIYQKAERYRRLVEKIRNFNAPNLSVQCCGFEEAIASHTQEFLYCDPPYMLGPDSTLFRGIYPQRNFPVHHKGFKHEALRDLLHNHKGGFMLSYNDCPTIRDWYSDFKIVGVEWQYTMGQGETRIGKNRANSHIKQSQELLILGF